MEYKHLILGLSFVLIGVSEAYSTEMHPYHEAHVHGQAVLNIVLDGSLCLSNLNHQRLT